MPCALLCGTDYGIISQLPSFKSGSQAITWTKSFLLARYVSLPRFSPIAALAVSARHTGEHDNDRCAKFLNPPSVAWRD